MNYLAHLFLASEDPDERLGSLIADFTRGRLQTLAKDYPPGVMWGIALHRRVDRFTDDNPWVVQSRRRIAAPYRRYSGIILDILYDHFLSSYWSEFSGQDRQSFIQDIYRLLDRRRNDLPARLGALVPRMQREDWLGSYAEFEVIGQVYQRMSQRMRQPNRLAGAMEEVRRHYPELAQDFRQFFPELIVFVQQQERMNRP
ncbi:acyl carrier protein phosphodiesterase [Sedimenticola sp.]|uniref:acyl carrier protein phosphodiesterase n=1 Tax=Sedimenticola sp. TaxID=1940285 RepID=UPI002587AADE|nr:ACP phosphodiesterase [Sedimenticola sp.]MCW8904955.1 ACP phosphodiesterase [Sedimenticola sp.]